MQHVTPSPPPSAAGIGGLARQGVGLLVDSVLGENSSLGPQQCRVLAHAWLAMATIQRDGGWGIICLTV